MPFADELALVPVQVRAPDPRWVGEGRGLAVRLRELVPQAEVVDHIGSTSVPGLAAKDCLDLMVRVAGLDVDVTRLVRAGFRERPEPWNRAETTDGAVWPKRVFAGPVGGRVTNVHVRVVDGANVRFALLFRDFLRADAAQRDQWGAFKTGLAATDLAGYGQAKAARYPELMARAEAVGGGDPVASVSVPAARWARWVENFERGHGATGFDVVAGALTGAAEDGSTFAARLPFDRVYGGAPEAAGLADAVVVPAAWGLLLVRKGGFAIARLDGTAVTASKIGQRHVQGRTKAGGQSQQRFARRRDNQARQAYEAAADHAIRILGEQPLLVVAGGDRTAVDEVLTEPRLARLRVVDPWLPVPDPRRAVLDQAALDGTSLQVEVRNA